MMPSIFGASMVGVPHRPVSGGPCPVDNMLNELSRQLVGNTRRYSRTSNGQPRVGNAMRICKPSSANNSPRSSTVQSRRRTFIGDGFQGRLQTGSPAMDQIYLPTPASEAPSETFYQRETRVARPLSWHPSSSYHAQQQSLFSHQEGSTAVLYPYSAYTDAEMLGSLQHLPPTPAIYSGYTSPADSFSPLSLPYSNFGSQPLSSPLNQPIPTPPRQQPQRQQQQQQQQQAPALPPAPCSKYPSAGTLPAEIPCLPPHQAADDRYLAWEPYPANSAAAMSRHTTPPTPEDFACGLSLNAPAEVGEQLQQERQQQQQQQQSQMGWKHETAAACQSSYQPLIRDDDAYAADDVDEPEGEILYGMGLYDAPNPTKASARALHHQPVVLSLLGGGGRDKDDGSDTGRGLGLKLEDAWEPPASEDEEEDGDDAEEDGDGEVLED